MSMSCTSPKTGWEGFPVFLLSGKVCVRLSLFISKCLKKFNSVIISSIFNRKVSNDRVNFLNNSGLLKHSIDSSII